MVAEEGEGQLSEWAEGQYGSAGTVLPPSVPPIEAASLATVNEIREAASQDPYPQWIYGALVSPEASTHSHVQPSTQGEVGVLHAYVPIACIIIMVSLIEAYIQIVPSFCVWTTYPVEMTVFCCSSAIKCHTRKSAKRSSGI